MRTIFMLFLGAALVAAQDEKKKVMCTLPVLKSVAEELGGGDFEVTALSKPDQDPHRVDPTPSLMKKLREAEVFIEIGLQLELWADEIANGSGNPNVTRGARGRVVASVGIPREEVPSVLSRSEGDIHPEGNPHVWLDPLRVKTIAENVAAALKAVEPGKAASIDERLKKFKDRIDEALFGPDLIKEVGPRALTRKALDGSLFAYLEEKKLVDRLGGWMRKAAPLRGVRVVEVHKTWVYFAKLFGFQLVGSVQPKPGIPPGPRHLQELGARMKAESVRLVIVDNFFDPAPARSLADEAGARVAVVPDQPGGEAGTDDYFKFVDHVLDRMLEALK